MTSPASSFTTTLGACAWSSRARLISISSASRCRCATSGPCFLISASTRPFGAEEAVGLSLRRRMPAAAAEQQLAEAILPGAAVQSSIVGAANIVVHHPSRLNLDDGEPAIPDHAEDGDAGLNQLTRYEAARQALAEATRVDEAS